MDSIHNSKYKMYKDNFSDDDSDFTNIEKIDRKPLLPDTD